MKMKRYLTVLTAGLLSMTAYSNVNAAASIKWDTVVNNGDVVPDSSKNFNAYNQPSVNKNGLVIIRARSKGPQRKAGIYVRNMKNAKKSQITKVIDGDSLVPQPNNNDVTFTETPSFPRIDRNTTSFAFRGNSQPVWTSTTTDPNDPMLDISTKIGTTGIFMQPKKELITGVNLLGAVEFDDLKNPVDFSYFAVPGETETLKFDVFPGAPTPVKNLVAFKGNYTVPTADPNVTIAKTGVYFRDTKNDLKPTLKKPQLPVVKIANTDTIIPNDPAGTTKFGSTAPPSAAGKNMVFAGFDNEETPTIGGIYLAKMEEGATLNTLVAIGDEVPGETEDPMLPDENNFTRLSEGVSYEGRYLAFWGAWGSATKTVTLVCSNDGNADRVAYCLENDNNTEVQVPVNQGFFVHDTKKHTTTMIARTTRDNFEDFVYWNYSGHPPSSEEPDEEGDAEPPRWRSSSFIAVDHIGSRFRAAFKATKEIAEGETKAVQGIYLAEGPAQNLDAHYTVIDTKTPGVDIDPDVAILNGISTTGPLIVSSIGIERDGLHGKWLSLNAGMANEDASVSWAGVYVAKLPNAKLIPAVAP